MFQPSLARRCTQEVINNRCFSGSHAVNLQNASGSWAENMLLLRHPTRDAPHIAALQVRSQGETLHGQNPGAQLGEVVLRVSPGQTVGVQILRVGGRGGGRRRQSRVDRAEGQRHQCRCPLCECVHGGRVVGAAKKGEQT